MTTLKSFLATVFSVLAFAGTLQADSDIHPDCEGIDVLRVWEWSDPMSFPEQSDPDVFVTEVRERQSDSFAIAFSGGGTRSAVATLGQLRMLHEFGWLDRAQYISAVSGGAWTAIPFTFLPYNFDEKTFLGEYIGPESMSGSLLGEGPDNSFVQAISSARVPTLFLSRFLFRRDEAYSRAIGKKLLRDFDLYEGERRGRPEGPARTVTYAARKKTLQLGSEIRRPRGGHPWKNLCPDGADGKTLCDEEILVPRAGRPFLIVGASVLEKKTGNSPAHLVEMTPLYTGSREGFQIRFRQHDLVVPSSYIEIAAYDSVLKWPSGEAQNGRQEYRTCSRKSHLSRYRYRMTLSDMMGTSGAAPAAKLRGNWLLRIIAPFHFGFPEFYTRPLPPDSPARKPEKLEPVELAHGDGGFVDDLGMSALLARGVKNILAFANSQSPFCPKSDEKCKRKNKGLRMAPDIQCYFEQTSKDSQDTCNKKRRKKNGAVPMLFKGDGFSRLLRAFEKLKEDGRPLIYCGEFNMLPAADLPVFARPSQPYAPRICWVQLDFNETWRQRLEKRAAATNDKVLAKLAARNGSDFRHFPNYKTFGERWWKRRIIDLSKNQVNALAHLTAWTVREGKDEIRECLLSPTRSCDFKEAEVSHRPDEQDSSSSGNRDPAPARNGGR